MLPCNLTLLMFVNIILTATPTKFSQEMVSFALKCAALAMCAAPALAGQSNLVLNAGDFILAGGATFIPGHGSPTGESLRTGSPGKKMNIKMSFINVNSSCIVVHEARRLVQTVCQRMCAGVS